MSKDDSFDSKAWGNNRPPQQPGESYDAYLNRIGNSGNAKSGYQHDVQWSTSPLTVSQGGGKDPDGKKG